MKLLEIKTVLFSKMKQLKMDEHLFIVLFKACHNNNKVRKLEG